MKALSLWQPWGSAVVPYGLKGNETRHWPTRYRGPLAVHAAKRPVRTHELSVVAWEELLAVSQARGDNGSLPLGALLGIVNLVDCVPVEAIRDQITERERRWGNYSDGRFAWQLEVVCAFPEPISYRGAQGFFEVPLVERDGAWVLGQLSNLPQQLELLR